MTDFAITAPQRRQLLAGSLEPLDFGVKPFGCKEGARYVLSYSKATAVLCDDGFVIRLPKKPVLWITVTRVDRVLRRGTARWRVRFDVTDLRDPDLYLRAGGGYTTSRWQAVDELCVPPLDSRRLDAVSEFWHQKRLARFAEEQKARSRQRRGRAA